MTDAQIWRKIPRIYTHKMSNLVLNTEFIIRAEAFILDKRTSNYLHLISYLQGINIEEFWRLNKLFFLSFKYWIKN